MIKKYGMPHFCKIDVEVFEYEVLRGLSQPIPYLSFEFAVESLEQTKQCIAHLKTLGYTKFNLAMAERDRWLFEDWQSADLFTENLVKAIQAIDWNVQGIGLLWGDIYACYE